MGPKVLPRCILGERARLRIPDEESGLTVGFWSPAPRLTSNIWKVKDGVGFACENQWPLPPRPHCVVTDFTPRCLRMGIVFPLYSQLQIISIL